ACCAGLGQFGNRSGACIINYTGMSMRHQPPRDIAPHPAQTDDSDLHDDTSQARASEIASSNFSRLVAKSPLIRMLRARRSRSFNTSKSPIAVASITLPKLNE